MSRLKRLLSLKFTHIGLFFAIPIALLSLTPSLLPREWVMQGVLTGIALWFGYGVGNAFGALYRWFEIPEFSPETKRNIKRVAGVIYGLLAIFMLFSYATWDNNVRSLVGLEANPDHHTFRVLLTALIVAYLFLLLSRAIRGFVRWFKRLGTKIFPDRVGRVVGVTIGVFLLIFLLNGVLLDSVMTVVNSAFSTRDGTTDEGVVQPDRTTRSGGPESLVAWDTLGRQGRKFTGTGPTQADINAVTGGGAEDPIRVYVGLKSEDTIEKRAELALEELKRTGAFERDVLVVATTTGTGWLDPGAVDTVEYVNNGDTAIVGLQYSYLPSWISLFVDQQITKDTATATLNAVHGYWSELDDDSRPELYLFGLSLGAFGSQDSVSDLRLVNDPIDGALWAGTPFMTESWATITDERDEGSPAWRPIVDEGRVVRFTGEQNELDLPSAEWGNVKYAYIQHATDPIVFFSSGLMFRSPDWLIEGERGPDLTPDMEWFPGVTFFQVAADLPMAGGVPNGHGHAYNPRTYAEVWADVTEPEDWSEERLEKIKALYP